jgi:hypothetical protein
MGLRGRPSSADLLLLLLFWSFAFALSSIRGVAAGEIPFALMAPHRAAIMLFAALLCWMTIPALERALPARFPHKLLLGLGGAALLSVLQSLLQMASCRIAPIPGYPPMNAAEAVAAGLVSFGYFAAWAFMQLALLHHRALAKGWEVEPPAAVPAPAAPAAPTEERGFWVSRLRQRVLVREAAIDWVEAQGDYVLLHARGGGGLLRETLSSLERQLDPALFVRVHRSALVRRSEIAAISRRKSGAIVLRLAAGAEVPVGRLYAAAVRDLLARPSG